MLITVVYLYSDNNNIKTNTMTTTQKAFNQIKLRIKEVNQSAYYDLDYWQIKDIKKALEIKLEEIALELTAERHANNY